MKSVLTLVMMSCLLMPASVNAQDSDTQPSSLLDKTSLGLGIGMDHGGFGMNIVTYPGRNVGLFAGVGYAIAGVGFNGGLKIRFVPESSTKSTHFYITGMYGYNAAIKVVDLPDFNKLFYGPTVGMGIDFGPRPGGKGYFSIGLLLPIRSAEVDDYMEELQYNYGVIFENDLPPVGISLSYRFVLK
jgi:hypothetical protein